MYRTSFSNNSELASQPSTRSCWYMNTYTKLYLIERVRQVKINLVVSYTIANTIMARGCESLTIVR